MSETSAGDGIATTASLLRGAAVALLAGAVSVGCGDRSAEAAGDTTGLHAAQVVLDTAMLVAVSLDSLYTLGKAKYDGAGWNEARAIWQLGLDRARHGDDAASEALLLTWLGLAAYQTGDYERAERLEREALEVERAHDLSGQLPRTFNALGLIAWQQGRLAEAATWYDSTSRAARFVGDASYQAKALVNLGLVETALGEIESARRHTEQGLGALRELGDAAMEARALVNLAALERDAGNPLVALDHARAALELARTTGEAVGEEAALGQLASLYLLLGRHAEALATVDSALTRARAVGLRDAEAANLEILAGLHRQLGHLPHALRLYDSAQVINRSLDEKRYETGLDLYHMAEIQVALGNLDVARTRAERARDIHRETGWTTAELADLLLLAEVDELAGDPEGADEHLADAGRLAAELGLRSSRLDVALAEARIADHRGDTERVLAALGVVENDLPVAGFAAEAEAMALSARALARSGELRAAEAAGRRAIELVGAASGELTSGLLRSTLTHSRADAYAEVIDILLRQERAEEAYEVAVSAGTRIQRRGAAPPGRAAERRGELLRRIDRLATEIRATEQATWDPDLVNEPIERLRAARREYEGLIDAPDGTAQTHEAASGSRDAARVRSALRPGEVLLQYLVGDERAFAFLVSESDVRARQLDMPPDALATRVRFARRLLERAADTAAATQVLEALHTELLGPLAEGGRLAGANRLIVIPHGVLTYLPFAALRNPATGRWLAEEMPVQYLPDAAMLVARDRRRDSRAPAGLDGPGAVFAPLTASLPATREEARAVASALAGDTRLERDERASEAAVRAALVSGDIVHIASHAELNAVNPLHSHIRLATPAVKSPDPASDGRLEVRELLGLSIRSPLVFLSGCETGLGTGWSSSYAVGEDFATLERGLLEAGAGRVVATLWRVEDRSAADFASRFYEHLRGADAATALASAQREMLSDPRSAHPFHWAAYRVTGNGPHE